MKYIIRKIDGKKAELILWCKENEENLKGYFLGGTGTTARMITEDAGLLMRDYF